MKLKSDLQKKGILEIILDERVYNVYLESLREYEGWNIFLKI